jgi:hypothetical protein
MQYTWWRSGHRAASYEGRIYDDAGDLTWSCDHRHAGKDSAVACAEQRRPQTLAACIHELLDELPRVTP